MPVLVHKYLHPAGELGLWEIKEEESWFLSNLDLSEAEKDQLSSIKGHRRVEWLSARMLIHHMSGREKRGYFLKDEFGKPHLFQSDFDISISHSREVSAAIAAPRKVGIDIQQFVPKIDRLIHKFLNPEESSNLDAHSRLWHLHVYWGAKEALYKAYGRRRLNFCRHILIEPFLFKPEGGTFFGKIKKDHSEHYYRLDYEFIGNYTLVYAMEE